MRRCSTCLRLVLLVVVSGVLSGAAAWAAVPGAVSGVVRDQTGMPLPGVTVTLTEAGASSGREVVTDGQGQYRFTQLETGRYRLAVSLAGFRPADLTLDLSTGEQRQKDIGLEIGAIGTTVTVTAPAEDLALKPSRQLITREDVDHIPGALRAGSLAAIVDTNPSVVITHDQMHVRGGHQVGFEIDGVPVPSSGLGSSFSLLFDPKDVKAVEFQRGAYSAEYGDRLYGQVNVITRSGFEQQRAGEAMFIGGQQGTTEGSVSYGDHSDRLAYFAQASANQTDLGLTPPSLPADHDHAWGTGGATKIWAPVNTVNLLTVTATLRANDYQIPGTATAAGTGDSQLERDGFLAVQWHHASKSPLVWSLTPYYHFNRVALNPQQGPETSLSSDARRIEYLGMKADGVYTRGKHEVKVGVDAFGGFLRDVFQLPPLAGAGPALDETVGKTALSQAAYVEDRFRPASNVTITAGLRWDESRAYRVESAWEPRLGVVAHLSGTPLTAHAYVGRFFQAPPLEALGVGGAQFAALGDQAFLLVRAERNTQWETGLSASVAGLTLDATYYQNHAANYLDHQQLGDSAVFLPVNIAQARLRGLELTAASPSDKRLQVRLVYAHGYAQARGAVTGGLGNISDPAPGGYYFLDHDQRDTAVACVEYRPTNQSWMHVAVQYGSGFLRGDGPDHLPSHVTTDAGAGLRIRPRWLVAVEAENLMNVAYFVNLSSEFNGTHVARPRSVTARLRVTF